MAVESKKALKVNSLLILIGGVLLLASSLLIFLLIVKGVYGNYKIEEILPTRENLTHVSSVYEKKAAILYSNYTENWLEDGSTWLSDNIDTWEVFMKSAKIDYEIIDDKVIELADLSEYGLIVLPGSKSLSDKEILKLKRYLENGGSIFATSGTATFSDEGKWRGWDFFSEVFGLNFTKEIEPKEFESKIHTLRGNSPITAGIPTGYALKIATWDRPIYAEILDPRTKQISFWYDFRKEKGLVREEIQKSAGIAHGTYGKGRFVWFGFELNSVYGEQEDYVYFDKLFRNCIHWLTYLPTAFIKDWPSPYQAAAVFIPTLDGNIGNVKNLISVVLSSRKYPATFFVDPYQAEKNKKIVREIAKYGEIGNIVDLSFIEEELDTANQKYEKELQFERIKYSHDSLSILAGKKPKGLMSYGSIYNEFTLQAMGKNKIDYFVTDSLADRSVPKVEIREDFPIMLINNTVRDDKKIIKDYGLKQSKFQRYTYKEDVDRILFESGLYVFKVHSSLQMNYKNVGVIKDVLDYLRSKNVWLTSMSEMKKWWLSRGDIEFRYETRSKRRVSVEVTNPYTGFTDDFVVQLNMNKKIKNIKLTSDIINTKIPDYKFDEKTNVIFLFIDNLEPSESRSFFIDFENVK